MPPPNPSTYSLPARQIVRAMFVNYLPQTDQIEWPPQPILDGLLARAAQVATTLRHTLGDRLVPFTRLDLQTAYADYGAPSAWGFEAMVWIEAAPVRGWYWVTGDESR